MLNWILIRSAAPASLVIFFIFSFCVLFWSICCAPILSLVNLYFPFFETHRHKVSYPKRKQNKVECRCKGPRENEDTLLATQMFPRLPARPTFVADTNVVSGTQKMFLILFRNILCPQQMFPSLPSPRNIMGNNVSATLCPIVYQGLKTAPWQIQLRPWNILQTFYDNFVCNRSVVAHSSR